VSRPVVAVLFGGRSSEHGVSCVTAGGVLAALDRSAYDVRAIGITRDGRWTLASDDPSTWRIVDGQLPTVEDAPHTVLPPAHAGMSQWRLVTDDGEVQSLGAVDVVFPVLHGPFGEDGTVQGALELVDVRYVGSGVLGSAIGMDKQFMRAAFIDAGLPVTDAVVLLPGESVASRADEIAALGLPVFVKPARAGSSMGISRVDDRAALDAAVAAAAKHDPKVLIERAVVGREIETAVLGTADGPRTSLPGEIVTGGDHAFYDFDAKYLDESHVQLLCPATLPEAITERIRDIAARAFTAVGAESLARVDVFVGEDGTVTVNEINTMPGFTPTSMYPRMWAATGMEYPQLVTALVETALQRPLGLR